MTDTVTGKDFITTPGLEGWRIISDGASAFYPEWWTLEDPAGNQADIASG